jgi:hypothetical protein
MVGVAAAPAVRAEVLQVNTVPRVTHELFVTAWQASSSPEEAAGRLCRTVAEVLAWAARLSKKGVRLKHLPHEGRPVRLPEGRVMVTRCVQAAAIPLNGEAWARGVELVPGEVLGETGAAGYFLMGDLLVRLPRRAFTRWVLG